MKILWVKTDFLHPTTRGGQIRTIEMLKRLHARHEVHYIALDDGSSPEGPARAGEYSSVHYAVPHILTDKRSAAFVKELAQGVFSELPVSVSRYRSEAMRSRIAELTARHKFDSIVCDFLFPAPSMPDISQAVVFQHNVEAMIWDRHAQHGATPLHRFYFGQQAKKMSAYEGKVCRTAKGVVAVSEADARVMESRYGLKNVPHVPTGVDIEYFAPPRTQAANSATTSDLVFLGSMDWLPNIDGAKWLCAEILPLIRKQRRETTVALVGRKPTPELEALGREHAGIVVTGTVPDVRPWLHGAKVSIVPLRIGGGTRLKIYEAMAACAPVVSTTIGAEGLDARHGQNILIGDTPEEFANACLQLLANANQREALSQTALALVADHYSWEAATRIFENCIGV